MSDSPSFRALAWVLATALLLGLVLLGHYHRLARSQQPTLADLGYVSIDTPSYVSDLPLVDSRGSPTSLREIAKRWTIVFFGFTHCPDVCPTTLSILNLALEDVAGPPEVVMVTVDPARDTPSKVGDYVRAFNPAFIGLSGNESTIRRVADELGISYQVVASDDAWEYIVEHSGALVVLGPGGTLRGYISPPLQVEKIHAIAISLMGGPDA